MGKETTSVRPAGLTPEVVVAFRSGRGVGRWQERNAESPVPGQWPYGLERLADSGMRVGHREVAELSGFTRRLASLRGLRRGPLGHNFVDIAITWEESTAVPMLAGLGAGRMFSGVIWATDTVEAGHHGPGVALIRRALRQMDGLWTLSRPQVAAVQEWLGADSPPVHFLPFGVDHEFYAPAPYPDRPHIVSGGGDRDRDPATLFAALDQVLRVRPGVAVTVQTGSKLAPPDGVIVVPTLTHVEMARMLASASVVAIPTRANMHASAITVALEAMSVGRPVVVSDTPGMRDDYFADGFDSFVVPTYDADALAERVIWLLDHPDQAAEIGSRGSSRVERQHTSATMCSALAGLITGRFNRPL